MKRFNYIILFILICIPFHAVYVLNNSSFFKTTYVEQLRGSSFDYVILGSSRGLTSLNTNQIDSLIALHGFNASLDDQNIVGSAMMLEHLLANDIEFKACILSLDAGDYEKGLQEASSNSYRWFSLINRNYIAPYFERFDDLSSKVILASRIWPGFAFWHNNKKLVPAYLLNILNSDDRYKFDKAGNFSYPVLSKNHRNVLNSIMTVEAGEKGSAFQRIQSVCTENEIDLVIYIAPYLNTQYTVPLSDKVINHSSIFFNSDSLFYDKIHVNSKGRKFVTERFAQDLDNLSLFP